MTMKTFFRGAIGALLATSLFCAPLIGQMTTATVPGFANGVLTVGNSPSTLYTLPAVRGDSGQVPYLLADSTMTWATLGIAQGGSNFDSLYTRALNATGTGRFDSLSTNQLRADGIATIRNAMLGSSGSVGGGVTVASSATFAVLTYSDLKGVTIADSLIVGAPTTDKGASYPVQVRVNQNAATYINVENNTGGTDAIAGLEIDGNSGKVFSQVISNGSSLGAHRADYFEIVTSGLGGINLMGADAGNQINFYAGGSATGNLEAEIWPDSSVFNDDMYIYGDLSVNGTAHSFSALTGSALNIDYDADAAEDNNDSWRFSIADGGVLTWQSEESGSYVAHMTLSPESGDGELAILGFLDATDSVTTGIMRANSAFFTTDITITDDILGVDSVYGRALVGSATVSSAVFQGDDTRLKFDPTPSGGAGLAVSGNTVYLSIGGTALNTGDPVYIDGAGFIQKANANGSATMMAIGMASQFIGAGSTGDILLGGTITKTGWTFTPGGKVYIGVTAGALTTSAPSGDAEVSQVIGVALTATKLLIGWNQVEVIK